MLRFQHLEQRITKADASESAERIIRALLGTGENADGLIKDAHRRIVEEFLRDRQQELAGVIFQVAKSLDPSPP